MDRVKAGGGKVLEGPMQVPDAWVLQAQDPQGAYFVLCRAGAVTQLPAAVFEL